ncbi:hypothetical protein QVD17_37365 [Tagetes erecta]|uniref:Uncharacterized protein n=1 Tax=Tagetes erecta TaxID=13708 RepID=A0AAD8NI97_TARER|nr:hypothetical protein QVD17_37365 [Tagetes erecta]
MEDKSMQGQSSTRHMNDYEKIRMKTIQMNNKKFQDLGLKNYAMSLTSLVESGQTKKKKPVDTSEKDVEYMHGSDSNQFDLQNKLRKYIAPQSMKRCADLAQKRLIVVNESRFQKGHVIHTRSEIYSRVLESNEG